MRMKASLVKSNWTRVSALGVSALIFAISASSVFAGRRVTEVNRRFERQQDRISSGISSGQLTAREAGRLETREANLKAQENLFRSENNGHLTLRETAKLNREENRLSRSIYRQKHDVQTQNH